MAYDQVSARETENTGVGREPTGAKSQIYGQVEPLAVPEVNGANSALPKLAGRRHGLLPLKQQYQPVLNVPQLLGKCVVYESVATDL